MVKTDRSEEFVADLEAANVLSAEELDHVRGLLEGNPEQPASELIDALVEQQILTRFQADCLHRGEAHQLHLSNYVLVDEIGTGSMGTVYKARSTRDGGWYAIKTVPKRNVVNLSSIAEKVEALKQVRHPRVSAMVHVGAQGPRVYMVWPLLEGGEKLDTMVEKRGRLAPRQAAQVALQIARGLAAYHEHDLFHGLLKSSDILIGADRRVRILDFGVGFLLTCERGKELLDTTTNNKALSRGVDCASPESILDPLDRTPFGDQYSLGCILYFCLTGQYPFPHKNPVKKMLAHQFDEPVPVQEMIPECPNRLAAVVHRLLRKAPGERFANTDDLVAELQAIASDSRVVAVVPPGRAAAPVSPSSLALNRAREESVEEEPASEPGGRRQAKRAAAEEEPSGGGLAWWVALAGVVGAALGAVGWLALRH